LILLAQAGTVGFYDTFPIIAGKSFSHLAAAGVAYTEEQDFFHCFIICFASINFIYMSVSFIIVDEKQDKRYNEKIKFDRKCVEYMDDFGFEWVEDFTLNGA